MNKIQTDRTQDTQDSRRDQIMDVAIELFSRNGFDAVSVRDLAAEAGVNLAMISYYFGSKDGLLKAIVERKSILLENLFQELSSNPQITCLDQLKRVVDMYADVFLSRRSLQKIMVREMMHDLRPETKAFINELWLKNARFIVEVVKKGIKTKEFRKVDPEMVVPTIIGPLKQISVAEGVVAKLLSADPDYNAYSDPQFRKRVTKHMYQLLEHLLLPS